MKFVHTNIVARDYKALAEFYVKVFNCRQIGPARNISGEWIEIVTGVKDAKIRGCHLELPGVNDVTLEIFEYNTSFIADKLINSEGLAHIAFEVDSVEETLKRALKSGGEPLSEIQKKHYPELDKTIEVVYIRDIEGNLIEIQKWN